MSVKFQVVSLLPVLTSLVSWSLAATNCPIGHFWNHTSCQPCSTCPPGFGLKDKCLEKGDTVCEACWPGYNYSNSSGMERCTLCDKYSNCLPGNAKVIKNCTIFSGTVCQGCTEGSYLHRYAGGPNGACIECSPPCGMFEKEERSCKTEHDRLCGKKEILAPSTRSVLTEKVPVITDNVTESVNGVSGETTSLPEPGTTDEPLHEKSWFWSLVSVAVVLTVSSVVAIKAVRCRIQSGRHISARNPGHATTRGDIMMQQCSPLMPRGEGQTTAIYRSSYSEPVPWFSGKVMASWPKFNEESDVLPPLIVTPSLVDHNGGKLINDDNEDSLTISSEDQNFNVSPRLQEPCRLVGHNEGKLRSHDTEFSLTIPSEDQNFDVLSPLKEPSKTMIDAEAESIFEPSIEWEHEEICSTGSNQSAASFSRMMWNISNLPVNADPKMVACGFVDHEGGKLTIGDTGVSLTIPPHAIPEGRTEGIFIAIMNQEKEHPKVSFKEPLLSPVVECGPTGLKFDRHVILSMPHCALLGEGSCNLKVQYNESEPGRPADWKELIDVSKQDGSEPYLAIAERNVVHIVVDHFTGFAVTGGQPGSTKQAIKPVKILAYVPQLEAEGDCAVRVYCVADTPAHLEAVHNQEVYKLGGEAKEIKPFDLMEGGSDLLVQVTNLHSGWTTKHGDNKMINFQHIWEGIERMPYCTFLFSLACKDVSHFRAAFVVKQVDCQDDKHKQEIIVSTAVKHIRATLSEISISDSNNNLMPEQLLTCTASESSAALLNADLFGNPRKSTFQANVLLGACAAGHTVLPSQLSRQTSGYFSSGFEPSAFTNVLSRTLYNELVILLDPPHPRANWKNLAEDLGFEMKVIRWLEHQVQTSPTFVLLTVIEKRQYPLCKLAETLHKEGRDDAAKVIEDQLKKRETSL